MDKVTPLFTATATATGGRNGHTEASDGTSHATRNNVDVQFEVKGA